MSWIKAVMKEFDVSPQAAQGQTTANFEVMRGSGNVFADLSDADAAAKQLKAQIAAEIIATLNIRALSARAAAKLAEVDPADIQRIRNADLSRFSLDRLIRIAYRLGLRVEMKVLPPDRLVSADLGLPDPAIHRVKQRDRRVVKLENFTDQDMALIVAAEVPAEYAPFDEELTGWQE